MSKPTSKVIQISTCYIPDEIFFARTALCEDGSIWETNGKGGWECVLEAFKDPNELRPIPKALPWEPNERKF